MSSDSLCSMRLVQVQSASTNLLCFGHLLIEKFPRFAFLVSMLLRTERFLKVAILVSLALVISERRVTVAQSVDPRVPTPIRTSSLVGKISARDLGDARLTDHYYTFSGTPGDLLITVSSQNLNGDIDVFTAGTLRPLLKLTLYAETNAPLTKGIYLRRREDLVLRVEARSPNDDEGSYQLTFSGSFEPIVGGPDIAATEPATTAQTSASGATKTRRVTSAGARINEPPSEVAVTPTPAPTPEPKPESTTDKTESTDKTNTARSSNPSRRSTGRRTTTRRTPAATPVPKEPDETSKPSSTTATAETPAESAAGTPKPKPKTTGRRSNTRTARPVTPQPTPAEPAPDTGPRLIIETNDGTMLNRSMSGVRRVMVENGQVVVVGKDGKVDRFLLVNVVRMSIAP